MVVSDRSDLGSLFRKKKKKPAPPPKGSTNYNFPMPSQSNPDPMADQVKTSDPSIVSLPGGGWPEAVKQIKSSAAIVPNPPLTVAPTSPIVDYLPWIVGGTVAVLGGVFIYLQVRK